MLFPTIKNPGRNIMATDDLGRAANPTMQFLNYLALELDREPSALLHGNSLLPLLGVLGSCLLLYCPSINGVLRPRQAFSLFAILGVAALRLRLRNRCGLGLDQNPPFLDGRYSNIFCPM
jgi:hypothetical protein